VKWLTGCGTATPPAVLPVSPAASMVAEKRWFETPNKSTLRVRSASSCAPKAAGLPPGTGSTTPFVGLFEMCPQPCCPFTSPDVNSGDSKPVV
jgi:hypothetical protein